MSLRNRYLIIIARTLLGLLFLFSGISGYYSAFHGMKGVPPEALGYTQVIWNLGIFQIIKTTEIVAGLMFVTGFLPQLASVIVAPLCVGIIVVNALTTPQYLVIGILPAILNSYLGYAYWDKYRPLFERRAG